MVTVLCISFQRCQEGRWRFKYAAGSNTCGLNCRRRASDVIDSALKYGDGQDEWRELLNKSSNMVAKYELLEISIHELSAETPQELKSSWFEKMRDIRSMMESRWAQIAGILNEIIAELDTTTP